MDQLPLDDQFLILLHKKIMSKTGSARRRAKKYYKDQYRKTGIIPKPLFLAAEGIMEGRKCSGRRRVLEPRVKKRFVEMLKASSDPLDDRFIFITRKGRTIKNYHRWLEEEFNHTISLAALRRYAREEHLKRYLKKPDFDEEQQHVKTSFNAEPVFDLIQIDGCAFCYIKIRDESSRWRKPQVIEFYDTGSRNMFVLEVYFCESSENAIDVFTQFLLSTPFPKKEIRIRPDNAKGFLNLKRPINDLNLRYSLPGGFFMKPNFARIRAPKHKAHLESSHRSLHNFEIHIIKAFEDRIVKTEPGYIFKTGRKEKITVTFLDIGIHELRKSGVIEAYRREHNGTKHYFSENGKTVVWIPEQKLEAFFSGVQTLSFTPPDVQNFMKYGFDKIRATVSKTGTLTYKNRIYDVVKGAEKFSRHKSTKVYLSDLNDKLLIFENRPDGILLGEALCRQPFVIPEKASKPKLEANEVERIAEFIEHQDMVVNRNELIKRHLDGLTLAMAKTIYAHNKARYNTYRLKLNRSGKVTGIALFNAFILDCDRHRLRSHVAPYAANGSK